MNSTERLKSIKEKQNEERVKNNDDLKNHISTAQLIKQKADDERRFFFEQHKLKEHNRKQLVEGRKREIAELDRNRKEAILRKSQERDVRIENRKKMERSSIVFAFGSSTPRMLDPTESGKAYWASRRDRCASTMNVMSVSMTAAIPDRSSDKFSNFEQNNDDKRRAASAENGRKDSENYCHQVVRKKTDLMPVVPSLRESLSSNPTPKGNKTPNRAVSMSRLDVLAQPRIKYTEKRPESHYFLKSNVDITKSMTHLVSGRKPVRYSAAFELRLSPTQVINPKVQQTFTRNKSSTSAVHSAPNHLSTGKKISTSSKNIVSPSQRNVQNHTNNAIFNEITNKSSLNKASYTTNSVSAANTEDSSQLLIAADLKEDSQIEADAANINKGTPDGSIESSDDNSCNTPMSDTVNDLAECDMTASVISSKPITNEEEAKAALTAKRKAAKEQAEKEAEERRKKEEAERIIQENYLKNEEREQLELLELAKRAEEERLNAAIEEMKKKEEEDQKKQEILLKQKLEKAEADRKAKEDNERLRQETELKLQKEEEERQARRKRVEAIMSRTRTNRLSANLVTSPEINS